MADKDDKTPAAPAPMKATAKTGYLYKGKMYDRVRVTVAGPPSSMQYKGYVFTKTPSELAASDLGTTEELAKLKDEGTLTIEPVEEMPTPTPPKKK